MPAEQPGWVDGHFYSPVVDPYEAERRKGDLWPDRPPEVLGIDFRADDQRRFLIDSLRPVMSEYVYPQSTENPTEFFEPNDFFMGLDSRVLFAMLRAHRPRRVVEIGSGMSSLLMADVQRRFLKETGMTCIEPYPPPYLRQPVPGIDRLLQTPVQHVPVDEFTRLGRDDLLFVDSSHVVKTGSDVNFILFEILPRLAPGVLVHFHDIFLPFEYPYRWVVEEGRSWNEQYALRALLMHTGRFEVVFGSAFAASLLGEEVRTALRGDLWGGSSLWLRVLAQGLDRPTELGDSAAPRSRLRAAWPGLTRRWGG